MSFLIQSIILGIVQGLTEFIPVSSSGHLLLLPKILNWESQPIYLDITLHLGTSLSLFLVFKDDLKKIVNSIINDFKISIKNKSFKNLNFSTESLLGLNIIVATIPAVIVGLLFNDLFEIYFREVRFGILFLVLGSVLMYIAQLYSQRYAPKFSSLNKITISKSLIIGFFQSLALFPGVSRSGSTISIGIILGFSKNDSARFSFLMSLPIILSAGLYKLYTTDISNFFTTSVFFGFFFSFISGLFAIKFLLKYLQSHSLYVFILYRLVLAFIIFLYFYI